MNWCNSCGRCHGRELESGCGAHTTATASGGEMLGRNGEVRMEGKGKPGDMVVHPRAAMEGTRSESRLGARVPVRTFWSKIRSEARLAGVASQ